MRKWLDFVFWTLLQTTRSFEDRTSPYRPNGTIWPMFALIVITAPKNVSAEMHSFNTHPLKRKSGHFFMTKWYSPLFGAFVNAAGVRTHGLGINEKKSWISNKTNNAGKLAQKNQIFLKRQPGNSGTKKQLAALLGAFGCSDFCCMVPRMKSTVSRIGR